MWPRGGVCRSFPFFRFDFRMRNASDADWQCPVHQFPVPPELVLVQLLLRWYGYSVSADMNSGADVSVVAVGQGTTGRETWLVGWLTAGLFALAAVAISATLIALHLRNWTRPALQRHVARILFMCPSYAICAFVSYRFPDYAIYINLYRDVYEGFAVYSFFSLLLLYLGHSWDEQRALLRGSSPQRCPPPLCCFRYDPKVPHFLLYCKLGIVQLFILRCFTSTFTVVLNYFGLFCETSMAIRFGHFWAVVLNSAGMGLSMFTLLSFYLAVHHELPSGRPIYQFLAIKFVLFISYIQMFTLTLLASMNVIRGSEEYSPQDVITAIGSFLTCVEMAMACVVNCFVFGWREFVVDDDAAVRRLSAAAAGVYVGEPVGAGSPGVTSGVAAGRWRQSGRLSFLDALVDAAKPDDLFDDGRLILGALLAWAGFKENSSAVLSNAVSEGYDDEDYRRERRSLLGGGRDNSSPASTGA